MKQKQNHAEHLHYIDDEGYQFEMEVIKRFTYEEKEYVLMSEHDEKHNHEGKNCTCHDKSHHHKSRKDYEKKELYVFESTKGIEGEKLIPVNDEMLENLDFVLERLL